MRIAVLGCGPAGLMAAHAARGLGHDITIFSEKVRQSRMFGAQYLHQPIPNATNLTKVAWVDYTLQGPMEGYRRKVYGDKAEVTVSPEQLQRHHPAWDIRETYFRLWDLYAARMRMVERISWENFAEVTRDFDVVISSIPKTSTCHWRETNRHLFHGINIYAKGEAPEKGIHIDVDCPRDMVICNGWMEPSWYRASNVFGHKTVEWSWSMVTSEAMRDAAVVEKPISNTCDCWPGTLYVGRYGSWTKGVLASDAYTRTVTALRSSNVQLNHR